MKALLVLLLAACAMARYNSFGAIRAMSAEKRATDVWSVLVAGSNTYSNYRHQSDICAMFQELKAMGIPEEHIIVMMYDDIANSYENPRPGVIINTPDGPDVYEGVPKDVKGQQVTAKNFIKVLNGVAVPGSGKKLKSNAQSNVFVFFSDHGGDDILAFPVGEYLTSKMLYDGIVTMSEAKMFKTLVINIEACEAGSMFYKYTYPEGVYITTASPVAASSYAWQWDDTVNAYTSDVWSWYMLHYMMDDHAGKTLQDQYDYTEAAMKNYSQPCQYGDVSIAEAQIDDFYGVAKSQPVPVPESEVVRAWDVPLERARRMHSKAPSIATAAALKAELLIKERVDTLAKRITAASGLNFASLQAPAYECTNYKTAENACTSTLAKVYRDSCGRSHDYLDSVTPVIRNMCRANVDVEVTSRLIKRECSVLSL